MLLTGILLPINGAIYDVGFPAWLTVRLPVEADRRVKQRLVKRVLAMRKQKSPRLKPLTSNWWIKRPREVRGEGSYLQQTIGPSAFRGRDRYISSKSKRRHSTGQSKSKVPITQRNLGRMGIHHDTRVSESKGSSSRPRGRTNRPGGRRPPR